MKILFKIFLKSYFFLGLLLSIFFYAIHLFFLEFETEKYINHVLKQYPENYFQSLISIFVLIILIDLKFKIKKKFFLFIKYFDKKLFFIIFIKFLILEFFIDIVFFKRVLLFYFAVPYIGYFFLKTYFAKNLKNKFIIYFMFFGLIVSFFPGYYLHPFFSGIPGWVTKSENQIMQSNRVYYKIYSNNEGIKYEEYFSHALFNPITMFGRPFLGFNRKMKWVKNYGLSENLSNEKSKVCESLVKIYRESYPYLEQGYYPYQKNLKNFAYPNHNLSYFYENYKKIKPKDIYAIKAFDTKLKINIENQKLVEKKEELLFECNYK